MMQERIYPVGIQDFEKLRQIGAIYVDKTDLIYYLTRKYYVFLSRPRRFGKSLLSSTLKYYFQGRKDLFQGLAIEELEKEWIQYPVLHFDLSTAKNRDLAGIRSELDSQLFPYEVKWGINTNTGKAPGQRLAMLIQQLHALTGQKTVVIIDEYDAPMLDVLHDDEKMGEVRRMMQEFYAPLKACDADLRFVFITGNTKSSQLNIFDVLSNLTNVSIQPEFLAICGITEKELHTMFEEDINILAEEYKCTPEKVYQRLKQQYGGYHCSEESSDIYNPFSLINAFASKKIKNHWFESCAPTYLFQQMKNFKPDLTALDEAQASEEMFNFPSKVTDDALPLLYQNGCLTIKSYNRDFGSYMLSIPNNEVREGLAELMKEK